MDNEPNREDFFNLPFGSWPLYIERATNEYQVMPVSQDAADTCGIPSPFGEDRKDIMQARAEAQGYTLEEVAA